MDANWLIFPKALLGGIAAATIAWLAIIIIAAWREGARARAAGLIGPVAVAGGWNALLHSPVVVILLAAAFGFGIYVAARR